MAVFGFAQKPDKFGAGSFRFGAAPIKGGAARFAPFAAPSGYRWDFVTENGQTVTERSEPVVALERVA